MTKADVIAVLRGLPDVDRLVFVLHRFERWPYSRIALYCRLEVGEVEHKIAEALARLVAAEAGEAPPTADEIAEAFAALRGGIDHCPDCVGGLTAAGRPCDTCGGWGERPPAAIGEGGANAGQ